MKNKLTPKEIKNLVRLLKKVKLPAPYPVFVALAKSVPFIAVDIAVMPDKNHILLTYRKDEFYDGWHIPGSILRYGELVENAYKRVMRKELGMKILKPKFINYFDVLFDYHDKGIVLLFAVKLKVKPKIGKYFSLKNLPENFLKCQRSETRYLKNSKIDLFK